ncbi:hypothetical protein [Flexivirga oryzae]|uniref:Uncharacterized protein n=1 Tax=Flexivirga oryzae TaxID=1794944 RepID=A0A839NF57_9MICO|nr:hypothetical protein [Flexivirga oryzae]MBB2894564.1 hypothetical protein [Flexivirga oryzae]
MVPGLAAALVEDYRAADKCWHLPGGCWWCSQVAELQAGRPTRVGAHELHGLVDHDALGCSGIYCHDSEALFVVTGDRWERLEDEQEVTAHAR